MHALLNKHPKLKTALPLIPLADLPTPVDMLTNLSSAIGTDVWLKHDENTGALYGGNKVRKLEFLLGDAKQNDCTDIVTFGAAGSNHALATAIYAKAHGFRCHVILTPQHPSPKVAKTLLYHLHLGTSILSVEDYAEAMQVAAELQTSVSEAGGKLYEIPFGGSSAMGTVGFVNAAFELAEQIRSKQCPEPEAIYLACGTSGSVTGLALGLRLAGINSRIIATQVTPPVISGPEAHCRLFDATNKLLHHADEQIDCLPDALKNVTHRDNQFGDGYAIPTQAATNAVELIQKHENIALETTYTGKSLASLVADCETSAVSGPVMFWNTYNAQPYQAADAALVSNLPDDLKHYFD